MIKILTPTQSNQLDRFSIEAEQIASIDLMERACHAFVNWYIQHFQPSNKIGIICGTGNNGGDGLGIARILHESRYTVSAWVVSGGVKESDDFKLNFEKAKVAGVKLAQISGTSDQGLFGGCDILIDSVFGSGLSRPLDGIYSQVIRCINATNAIKIAIDIPSGLRADQPSEGEIVKAHYTVSFQLPKLAFFLPENNQYVGEWNLVDIGLNKEYLKEIDAASLLVTRKDVKKLLIPRKRFSHKGNYGHALLISGSLGKMGACILSAKAAVRSGLGLLTVCVPKGGNQMIQVAVPEAMSIIDVHENHFSKLPPQLSYDAIGVGPGIGQAQETVEVLNQLILTYQKPMVIDADAINILAANRHLLKHIPTGSILTPHPKEFQRLVGSWRNDFERLEMLRALSIQTKTVIVLKGAFTSICSPDGLVYFNPTGNPGMAKGGSGDVLTGILTGLLAQGYKSIEAAILGVYLHGFAGDLAVHDVGTNSLIASDLIEYLPKAYKGL